MNDHFSSARRVDEQLLTIMDHTAKWTVNGRAGCVLRTLPSLRDAIRAVFEHEATGQPVFAICRQPGDAVILFREQIARLANARHDRPRGDHDQILSHFYPEYCDGALAGLFLPS